MMIDPEWLECLKAGDEVGVKEWWNGPIYVHTVARRTPTQIILAGSSKECARYSVKDGFRIGADRGNLVQLTDQNRREALLATAKLELEIPRRSVTVDQLERILTILKEQ